MVVAIEHKFISGKMFTCMSCKMDLLIPSLNLFTNRRGCNFDRCLRWRMREIFILLLFVVAVYS
jgi:hypothetical protein